MEDFFCLGLRCFFVILLAGGTENEKKVGKKLKIKKSIKNCFGILGVGTGHPGRFGVWEGIFFFFFLSLFFWVFWRIYYYRLITMGAITTASPQSLRSLQPPRSLQPLQSLQSKPGLSLPDLSLSTYYYGEYHYPSLSLRNHYLYGVHYHRSHHYPAPYYYGFLYLVGHPVIFLVTFGKT